MNTGSTEVGPRFDRQGTFLPHSVLGPTHDYASELKNTGRVSNLVYHVVHLPPVMFTLYISCSGALSEWLYLQPSSAPGGRGQITSTHNHVLRKNYSCKSGNCAAL